MGAHTRLKEMIRIARESAAQDRQSQRSGDRSTVKHFIICDAGDSLVDQKIFLIA